MKKKVSKEVLKEGLELSEKLGAVLVEASGGVWKTTPIEQTPEITLGYWTIRQLSNGDRHFVGWNVTEGEGRVSSKIVEFDKDKLLGITNSGRVYKLIPDDEGMNMDAEYVWGRWSRINNVVPDSWTYVDLEKE